MKIRKIIRYNNAVSGVIEALLIVALIAIILAIIQLVYIPPIMEDKETEILFLLVYLVSCNFTKFKIFLSISSSQIKSSPKNSLSFSFIDKYKSIKSSLYLIKFSISCESTSISISISFIIIKKMVFS